MRFWNVWSVRRVWKAWRAWLWVVVVGFGLAGCEQDMANQPRYEAYEAAPGWKNDQSALEPVPGTVSRGADLGPVPETLPMPLTAELLEEGRARYNTYCSPCHGRTGDADGMVVQRGFPAPPSLHNERLRSVALRHFYNVMTDGYGIMYSYAARVAPQDRWAVAAYIRALQLSQHASPEDLNEEQRASLEGSP
ncbi:c-type cytochrome [Marinobacter fonticola]|uniref:c-type cytochrome n=1 Tax=Marinobacter fonticola TaxID=2603215 RepID=UPI0011E7A5D0|nr:cytochrome c [Marinobacter fonticola]